MFLIYTLTISVGCPYSASRIACAFAYPSSVNGSPSISFLACFSNSSFRYPNLVRGARLEESISEVNFPQNGSHSSVFPLNFDMDNLGSLAAEDNLHSSVAFFFGWLIFAVHSLSQTLLSALKSLSQTPSAVYDSQTLFSLALPYLSLGLRIELFLLLGRLSQGVV